jgi:predicted choloylglycine hydrolase
MCTTAVKKVNDTWFLMKTRDPVSWMRHEDEIALFDFPTDTFKKLIIQNPVPYEDGYYGGMNDQGVTFISTFVRTSDDQISYIRKPYIRLILEAKTAKEAVGIIKTLNPKIGGNMFVADQSQCFGIEATAKEYFVEEVKISGVKTNHFLTLPDKNLNFEKDHAFKPWSEAHQQRAEELVHSVQTIEDCERLLSDRKNCESSQAICSTPKEAKVYTYSAMIFDTKNKIVRYAQGCPSEVGFKEYSFTKIPSIGSNHQVD